MVLRKISQRPLYDRGFTLIELLVVISIIGMLSSIVLASLNSARRKAADAKIRSQLYSLRSAIGFYITERDNYTTLVVGAESPGTSTAMSVGPGCATGMFADPRIAPLLRASAYPSTAVGNAKCTVSQDLRGYAISIRLSDGTYLCAQTIGNAVVMNGVQGYAQNSCSSTDLSY